MFFIYLCCFLPQNFGLENKEIGNLCCFLPQGQASNLSQKINMFLIKN